MNQVAEPGQTGMRTNNGTGMNLFRIRRHLIDI